MECCQNCGRAIGDLETAHVHQDHVVCLECMTILSRGSAPAIIEDLARPFGPKPKPPLFSFEKIVFVPQQTIKLVLFDKDTGQVQSKVINVDGGLSATFIITTIEKGLGVKVQKIAILERQWIQTTEMTGLEQAAVGLGILSLLR
jgi:hypothetical protein